jgi:hypothetical protein
VNGVDELADLVGIQSRIVPEDRRHFRVGIQQNRNQRAIVVDGKRCEDRDFVLMPRAIERGIREKDDAAVALVKSVVDSRDEVLAGVDFPVVPPRVNAFFAQGFGNRSHTVAVNRAITEKDPLSRLHRRLASQSMTHGVIDSSRGPEAG